MWGANRGLTGYDGVQEISQDLYIIGLIAAAACALSVVMGVIYFLFTLCGGAGSHICCAAVPVGYVWTPLHCSQSF